MTRVAGPLASFAAVVLLLSGCGNDETPDRAADESSTSPTATSDAPESSSTEVPPDAETSSTAAEDPVSITLYDADFVLDDEGDLSVVETLTLDVPVDDRHGIYRSFDGGDDVEDFTATLDGAETPIADSVEDGDRQFKIGDPDQTLSVGQHVVRMEYEVADVLTDGDAAARSFSWYLIPAGWGFDIATAELTVTLPVAATDVECTVGASDPCELVGAGTTTLVVTASELDERTPVLLQAGVALPADA